MQSRPGSGFTTEEGLLAINQQWVLGSGLGWISSASAEHPREIRSAGATPELQGS